ncbi:MAG: 50S ribosomal protein L6 [Kiritimatiellae bacterium]|nr:50S ribosomal protein L6 [Kiritimatiellia bacterium]
MSRIGKKPIEIPAGVEVQLQGRDVCVSGPKGKLKMSLPGVFEAVLKDKTIVISPKVKGEKIGALHGLYRSLAANIVKGVASGYSKSLEIQGVGFKAAVQGRKITLNLGFSRPVEMAIPEGIEIKMDDNVNLTISGPDKQRVGDFAAHVKSLFPAEPYKGKGIRFKGEYVRRKVGKTVA